MGTENRTVTSAQVTVTFADGRTERFDLDTRDEPIGYALDVENDVVDATPPDSARYVRRPGTRWRVSISLSGRGPRIVESNSDTTSEATDGR